MAYCTIAQIKSDFKALEIEDNGTAITTAEANEIIEQVSEYIDGVIGLRYRVPINTITYPSAGKILAMIATFICAERIKNILEVKTGANQMESEKKQPFNSVRTPRDDLKAIANGSLLLKDVPLVSSNAGVSSFNSDNCIGHTVDVTKQQW